MDADQDRSIQGRSANWRGGANTAPAGVWIYAKRLNPWAAGLGCTPKVLRRAWRTRLGRCHAPYGVPAGRATRSERALAGRSPISGVRRMMVLARLAACGTRLNGRGGVGRCCAAGRFRETLPCKFRPQSSFVIPSPPSTPHATRTAVRLEPFVTTGPQPAVAGDFDEVNLNPDKICSFDCIYCQVDRTRQSETRFVEFDAAR